MSRLDYFERGRELYKGKRYEEAAEHFLLSIVKEYYNVSQAWLADCYEYGLGVEKNLLMAKDLYMSPIIGSAILKETLSFAHGCKSVWSN